MHTYIHTCIHSIGNNGPRGDVRNLGKPVGLCQTYYSDGADEVVFLNITSFRNGVIEDLPMLQVLEKSRLIYIHAYVCIYIYIYMHTYM